MDSKQLRAMSVKNAHAAIKQAQTLWNPNAMYQKVIQALNELETTETKPVMLTIQNIEKLFRKDVYNWRISGVETLPSTYIIHLRKPNGERHQVNLERNGIGVEYELWCWKGVDFKTGNMNNAKPERLMIERKHLRTMDEALRVINLVLM